MSCNALPVDVDVLGIFDSSDHAITPVWPAIRMLPGLPLLDREDDGRAPFAARPVEVLCLVDRSRGINHLADLRDFRCRKAT